MFVKFFGVLIIFQLLNSVFCVHKTIEEAKAAREILVKKHLKRLKKEEGALKLVGGQNDYEGIEFLFTLIQFIPSTLFSSEVLLLFLLLLSY